MRDWIEGGARHHNRALLAHITGVDPHRWFTAERVDGLVYDWWSVDFGEPEGPRLGVVDTSKRPDPEVREWPFAEAVAAIGSAWPKTPIVVSSKGVMVRWRPEVLCLPRLDVKRVDPVDVDEYEAAAWQLESISTVFSGPTIMAATEMFEAVAAGMDLCGRDRLAVDVQARPLHREDCLGEADFVPGAHATAGYDAAPSSDEQAEMVAKLGAMADQWCPLGEGDPATAQRATNQLGVEVAAVELTVEWFTLRWDQLGADAPWWCHWCPEPDRGPALYVVGGTAEGTVACADHLSAAAELEAAAIIEACE